MRTATFQQIGVEGYDLTAISVTGAEGIGDVVAQLISSEGTWNGEYYFLTEDGAGVTTGWYKDATGDVAVEEGEVILPQGGAFALYSDYNELELLVGGEVVKGDYVINFAQGSGMIGNGLPVERDLTEFVVAGSEGIGDVVAQAISAEGTWDGEYYFLTEDGAGVTTGWYKDATGDQAVEAGEVTIAPGESLSLYSDYNDLVITLPKAID